MEIFLPHPVAHTTIRHNIWLYYALLCFAESHHSLIENKDKFIQACEHDTR